MRKYNTMLQSVLVKSSVYFHIYLSLRDSYTKTDCRLWKCSTSFRKAMLLKFQISYGWTSDWGFSGNKDCAFCYCTKGLLYEWERWLHQLITPSDTYGHVTTAWFDALMNFWIINDTSRKPTFGDIKVEEVTVKDCLDHASHNGNHVKEALKIEAPDPVDKIEGSIQAQAEQVVGGDCLRLTSLADHEELRQNCHRLQVNGERPKDLMTKKINLDVHDTVNFTLQKGSITFTGWTHL